jgi:hypothetical protein
MLHDDQPWRQRLEYVCAQLFNSSTYYFARGIELDVTHVKKVLTSERNVTVKFLAQVLSHTAVRADWLIWGNGPMLYAETPGVLSVPADFQSLYPVFNTLTATIPPVQIMPAAIIDTHTELSENHVAAATAIHKARCDNSRVMLFVSAPAVYAGAGIVAADMLRKKYLTAVSTTGTGLLADIEMAQTPQTADLNYVARLAAGQGVGYGEAVGRWAFNAKDIKTRSLLYTAYSLGVPATAHVELGELRAHTGPSARGAELGAAIGAASYTDLLVFTEQVRQLCESTTGVFIFVGDTGRGLQLFLQARAAASATANEFIAIFIDSYVQPEIQDYVKSQGGQSYKLTGAYRSNLSNLLRACDAIFSGKNPHDDQTAVIDNC